MRFLRLSRASWVTVVIMAVLLALVSETPGFLRNLLLNLVIVAVLYIVLTALGQGLMRLLPEGRFRRFLVDWL